MSFGTAKPSVILPLVLMQLFDSSIRAQQAYWRGRSTAKTLPTGLRRQRWPFDTMIIMGASACSLKRCCWRKSYVTIFLVCIWDWLEISEATSSDDINRNLWRHHATSIDFIFPYPNNSKLLRDGEVIK